MDKPKRKKRPPNPMGKYIIHSNHDALPIEKGVMHYLAFDPGSKNPAIRIERRCRSSFGPYCTSITTLTQFKTSIVYQRYKLSDKLGTCSHATLGLIEILDDMKQYYDKLDIVLIEHQLDDNPPMMHFQHTVIAYFLCRYPHVVTVEISSKLKSEPLGAPPKMTRHFLKKWGEDKATELAKRRGDCKFRKYIKAQTEGKLKKDIKIDDDCDVLLSIEGFCTIVGYQTTYLASSSSSDSD